MSVAHTKRTHHTSHVHEPCATTRGVWWALSLATRRPPVRVDHAHNNVSRSRSPVYPRRHNPRTLMEKNRPSQPHHQNRTFRKVFLAAVTHTHVHTYHVIAARLRNRKTPSVAIKWSIDTVTRATCEGWTAPASGRYGTRCVGALSLCSPQDPLRPAPSTPLGPRDCREGLGVHVPPSRLPTPGVDSGKMRTGWWGDGYFVFVIKTARSYMGEASGNDMRHACHPASQLSNAMSGEV